MIRSSSSLILEGRPWRPRLGKQGTCPESQAATGSGPASPEPRYRGPGSLLFPAPPSSVLHQTSIMFPNQHLHGVFFISNYQNPKGDSGIAWQTKVGTIKGEVLSLTAERDQHTVCVLGDTGLHIRSPLARMETGKTILKKNHHSMN